MNISFGAPNVDTLQLNISVFEELVTVYNKNRLQNLSSYFKIITTKFDLIN